MDAPYINIHTHSADPDPCVISILSVLLRDGLPDYPAPPALYGAGVHPWDAAEPWAKKAVDLLDTFDLVAVGEIGLDYAKNIDHKAQQEIFEKQLSIAQRRGLPVILHCARAFEPVMKALSRYRLPSVIFHSFIGNRTQAANAVKSGYYLSFGQRSLNSDKTVEALRSIPLGNVFFETDDADVSIKEIYERAAGFMGISDDKLRENIYGNYKKIFE